jgi:hypothetical protein
VVIVPPESGVRCGWGGNVSIPPPPSHLHMLLRHVRPEGHASKANREAACLFPFFV